MKNKLPLWVFPLFLVFSLLICLIWSLNLFRKDVFFTDKRSSRMKTKKIDLKSQVNNYSVTQRFQKGLSYFKQRSYNNASILFQSLYKENIPNIQLNYKIATYYGFSLLMASKTNHNDQQLQLSYRVFQILLNKMPSNHPLINHVILGYAQSSRYMQYYPYNIDLYLKESSVKAYRTLQKQLLHELAYYYLLSKSYIEGIQLLIQNNIQIDMPEIVDKILKENNISKYLIPIIENKLIDRNLYLFYKENIYQTLLLEGVSDIDSGHYFEASNLLKKIYSYFSNSQGAEEILYLLGVNSYRQGAFDSASKYYLKVLNNNNTKRDAQAYYSLGTIYINQQNFDQAVYYLKYLIKKYPNTVEAQRAKSYINNYNMTTDNNDENEWTDIKNQKKELVKTVNNIKINNNPSQDSQLKENSQKLDRIKQNSYGSEQRLLKRIQQLEDQQSKMQNQILESYNINKELLQNNHQKSMKKENINSDNHQKKGSIASNTELNQKIKKDKVKEAFNSDFSQLYEDWKTLSNESSIED